MNVGDKVRIHPEIGTFDRRLFPMISDGMIQYAGIEGTLIETYDDVRRRITIYRVAIGYDSWYFRREWLIFKDEENQTEISINLKDIQNLLL